MKAVSILYNDIDDIVDLIGSGKLIHETQYLVRIFTSIATENEAVDMAESIHEMFPNSQIIGCSTVGIMFNDKIYDYETMIIFEEYERASVHVNSYVWKDKTGDEIGREIAAFADENMSDLMHILFSDGFINTYDVLCEFNRRNSRTKLVGGIAGDITDKNISGYVFDETGIKKYSVIVASIQGDGLFAKSWLNISHEPISDIFTVTGVEEDAIITIDDTDAKDWVKEQLGFEELKDFSNWKSVWKSLAKTDEMIRFPIILENHHGAGRFLRYDKNRDVICQYHSKVPEGIKFRIGYTSPGNVVKKTHEICRDFENNPVEYLFFYMCYFRKLHLNSCARWEVSPFRGNGLCGAFLMGEIGNEQGSNEYLNGSTVLLGISEREVYIKPDRNIFAELNSIEDETKDLLNFALLKQRKFLSKSNEKLLSELIKHQESMKNNLYYDSVTGLKNHFKYKEDLKEKNFDKLCMIRVENSETLIMYVGHDMYKEAINKESGVIVRFVEDRGYLSKLYVYSLSENIIIIASDKSVNNDHFRDIMNKLFDKIHFLNISDGDSVLVNRFVLVFEKPDLIECALNTFQSSKYLQIPFMIYDRNESGNMNISNEFKMISIIIKALEKDGVVPYFQGIYDNILKKITKYEALMRIVDEEGKVYIPSQFMDIAKKYHLYTYLSKKMISKVIDLFKDRKEIISINFSVFDINSDERQEIIFKKLDEIKDGSRIILEILEDEKFKSFDALCRFIKRIRSYGVKIAIDDFGSGYSNFLEIMDIRPDYIKIDGGIIKTIDDRETSDMIIDTIVFLGKRVSAGIVAEYVENYEIQENVKQKNIQYSQGYYFSIPKPFEEIDFDGE